MRLPTKLACLTTLLLAVTLFGLSGCSSTDNKSQADAQPATSADPAKEPPVPPTCRRDEVDCGSEINAFGICLGREQMVEVAGGAFVMGRTEEKKPYSPQREVTVKAFLIDKTEVSVAQYRACVDCGVCKAPLRDGSNSGREPYYGNAVFEDFPVIYVTWQDAKTYCEQIGKRLPTEAEWEKAARGSQGADYPWGADPPRATLANYGGLHHDTTPVASFAEGRSPSGALNMAGNVWEWVNDGYDANYYSSGPNADPPGPAAKVLKVARGGGFNSSSERIKSYTRDGFSENAAFSFLGFRCAKDSW